MNKKLGLGPAWPDLSQEKKAEYLSRTHELQNADSQKAMRVLSACDYEAMGGIPFLVWLNLRRDGLIEDEHDPRITNKRDYIAMYGV